MPATSTRRRILVTTVGCIYVLITAPLAEVGGGILGGGCNEPVDSDNATCQAIWPEWVDAWQVMPVAVVALIALAAIFRGSYRTAHAAFAAGLVLPLLIPLLVFEFLL